MSRLALRNGKVFDSVQGKVLENSTVIIDSNIISWIGPDQDYNSKDEDQVILLENKYIFPGLFDLHVHLTYLHDFVFNREKTILRTKEELFSYYALKNAQNHLRSGFTFLRDCGASTNAVISLKKAFD
jgi:imidazolonepropionase-like amidohydrolase